MGRIIRLAAIITLVVVGFDVSIWINESRDSRRTTTGEPLGSRSARVEDSRRADQQVLPSPGDHDTQSLIQSSPRAQSERGLIGPSGKEAGPDLQAEQLRPLAEQLDEAKRNAAAQIDEAKRSAAAQINALQMQLTSEQAKATRLDNDLAGAHAQLVQADRQKAAGAAAMKEVEKRAQVSAEQQEEAKRTSAAQIGALQAQLDSEQTKTMGLDGDLVRVRGQLAKADQERAAGDGATKDDETVLLTQQKALSEQLDEAKRTAATQISALQVRLNEERAKTASLDGDLGRAREQLAQADRDKATEAASAQDSHASQQALTEQLESARRTAAAQISDLQAQLDSQTAKTTDLDGELARIRERVAQAERDKAAEAAATAELRKQQAIAERQDEEKRIAAAQVSALQSQLDNAQAKSTGLDDDLARLREQIAVADREKATGALANRDNEAELAKQQQALSEQLDEAERSAAAQIGALQTRLSSEQAKTTEHDGDPALADREKAAATKGQETEQRRLAKQLEDSKQAAATQIASLQARLNSEQAKSASLDGDLSRLREQVTHADREKSAATAALKQQQALTTQIEDAKRAATNQMNAVQMQLNTMQAKATNLAGDLAREQLAKADQQKTAWAAAAKDYDAKLQQERQALLQQLDEAKRSAAAQTSALRLQLNDAEAKTTSLAGDLARAQSAQADRDTAARMAAAKDYDAKLHEQQQSSAKRLDEATRAAGAQIATLQMEINNEQAQSTRADANGAGAQPGRPDQGGTADPAPEQGSEPGAQTGPSRSERRVTIATRDALPVTGGSGSGGPSDQITETSSTKLAPTGGQVSLPDGVPARIVLRYSRDSEAARARAMSLRQILRAQGLDVADPVGTPVRIPTNSVTYFYLEDRNNAKVVADVLATSGPIRGRPPANEPAPRPGTIDVSIAG